MPTQSVSYTGAKLETHLGALPHVKAHQFGASQTLAKGTVVGYKTADGKLYAYANANVDGTEVARGITLYDIVTDANGQVTYGDQTASEWGGKHENAVVIIGNAFVRKGDITGLDATALTDLGAREITNGTTDADDLVYIP